MSKLKKKRFILSGYYCKVDFFFQVAQKFYSVLMLKKFQVVELEQESSYAEIYIEKGINFTNPTL